MNNGKKNNGNSSSGEREIVSVSLPLHVYNALQLACGRFSLNRSAMITSAITERLKNMGIEVILNVESD